MIKVKICGITNLEDALASVEAGCQAIGFVFYRGSCRYIDPRKAAAISRNLPKYVSKIGVFVNAPKRRVEHIAKFCGLDILQFHGEETPKYCSSFKKYKIVKSFRIKDGISKEDLLKYKPFAYLFDSFTHNQVGGSGKKFDWKLIRHLSGLSQPIFLAGGLNAQNVKEAIRVVHPAWVDACSSIEVSPGKKDHAKIREFIRAVRKS